MKIIRESERELVMERTPWLLALFVIVFGLVFLTVGLSQLFGDNWRTGLLFILGSIVLTFGCLAAFVRRVQVIFDRSVNSVTLRRRSFYNFVEIARPLDQLSQASVQSSYSSDTTTHRTILEFSGSGGNDMVPITLVYTSSQSHHQTAKVINRWLGDQDAHIN